MARSSDDDLVDDSPRATASVRRRPLRAPPLRTEAVRTDKVRKRRAGSKSEDVFWIPDELRERLEAQGLSWEFKRTTYFGKEEDPDYHIGLQENAWEPLSLNSFPEFKRLLPKTWTKDTFEKRGQVLMVRPKELTQEARDEEYANARDQVKGQMASLKEVGPGEADRTLVKVKRSYERPTPVE